VNWEPVAFLVPEYQFDYRYAIVMRESRKVRMAASGKEKVLDCRAIVRLDRYADRILIFGFALVPACERIDLFHERTHRVDLNFPHGWCFPRLSLDLAWSVLSLHNPPDKTVFKPLYLR